MIKLKLVSAFAAAVLATAGPAAADTVNGPRVTSVGNQGGQLYAILLTAPPGCASNIVYHSSETEAGPYVMSLLMSARLTNTPLARLDYTIRAGNACWIDLIQL